LLIRVYRTDTVVALCTWDTVADDPAHGVSVNGPLMGLATGRPPTASTGAHRRVSLGTP
jgi:hypothetical protein